MNKLIRLFLVLAVVFLAVPTNDAQAAAHHPTGAIAGKVLDSAGNPVKGAIVEIEIHTRNGHVFNARMKTDRDGKFGLRKVPVGRGTVKAHKQGVGRGKARVIVEKGKLTRVRIKF